MMAANGTASLELVWNPMKAGIFKDVVQLTDSKGNKKDVYLTMKAIEVKKPGVKKSWQAPPAMPKRLKTSPQRPVVKKQAVMQQKASLLKSTTVQDNRLASPVVSKTRPLADSNLNATNIFNAEGMNFSNLDNLFAPIPLGKENKSPITPPNFTEMFNDIKFTPRTETIPKESSCLEYLASLPTPKGEMLSERNRPSSPERVRFTIPEMSITKLDTPNMKNVTDMSVMAQMPTPSGIYGETSLRPSKGDTIKIERDTPARANTTNFDPHVFSTLTKLPKKIDEEDSFAGKELFFDALEEMSFATPKPLGSMERFSSETYVKCSISPMSVHEDEIHTTTGPVMDKTRVVTPPPPLSMIEEESEVDTTSQINQEQLQSKTFNVKDHNRTPPNLHKKAVEEVILKVFFVS